MSTDDRSPVPASAGDASSPFDAIRQVDADGEFWSARDLMPLLEYDSWRRFEGAIERARISCQVAKHDPADHFAVAVKVISGGRWGEQEISDVRLSRFACYLIGMNGDVRKDAIAKAQAYFAYKTRQAEVEIPLPRVPEVPTKLADALRLAADKADEAERLAIENATLKPAAQSWTHLASAEGDYLVGDAAKILQRDPAVRATGKCRPNILFKTLRDLGWIYKRGHRDRWHAKQPVVAKGWMTHRAQEWADADGVWHTGDPQVRLTVSGISELHRLHGGSEPLHLTDGPDASGPTQLELPSGGAA